jgi:hypothetical protein
MLCPRAFNAVPLSATYELPQVTLVRRDRQYVILLCGAGLAIFGRPKGGFIRPRNSSLSEGVVGGLRDG